MKKLLPVLTALIITGLIISILFMTGVLKMQNSDGSPKKIDLKGIMSGTSKTESLTFVQHMEKGDEYAKKGMASLAFNEYIAANQLSPSNTDPYMKIGKLLFDKKEYQRAQQIFQQLLQKDPANLDANIYLVRTFITLRNPEKARDALNAIQGDSLQKWYYSGVLSAYFGDYDNAKKALNEVVKINTDGAFVYRAQKILGAFNEYNLNQGSQEIFLKTLIAKSFNEVKEYTLSIPLLFKVVKEKKDYRDAWILLGYAYLNIDDGKNAIDAFEEAKKLDRNKPETLFFLGLSYSKNNQNELAAQLIESAINKGFEPKIQAQQKLAEIYLNLKQYQKAAAKYESVIAMNESGDANEVDYYIRPMWIYIDQLHQPAQALILGRKAVTKYPDNGMAHNLLGWAYLAVEDFSNARNSLAKALEIDPNLSAAYLNLGKLYERLAYNDTAKQYYQTAFRLGEGTSIGDTAAGLYNKLGGLSITTPGTENTINSLNQSMQADITSPQTYSPPVSEASPQQNIPKFVLPPLSTAP